MVFKFIPRSKDSLLEAFASFLGGTIQRGQLKIPEKIGEGYVQGHKLGASLKLMVHRYILKEDLLFRRIADAEIQYGITFTFHTKPAVRKNQKSPSDSVAPDNRLPAVQITSANIDYETLFPANTSINTIIIVINREDLKQLLSETDDTALLQTILPEDRPYFYEEMLSPKMHDVAAEILQSDVATELGNFFYKIKTHELIFLFLAELLKRGDRQCYPVNNADIKLAYRVRDKVILDLSVAPKLNELAQFAGMSESKLKRLFKQIFGDSIYNYYQTMRMREAAYLIKEKNLSVSDAGYRVGFTNLSHFSRLFERYLGVKPKKYSGSR